MSQTLPKNLNLRWAELSTRFIASILDIHSYRDDVQFAANCAADAFLKRSKDRLKLGDEIPALGEIFDTIQKAGGKEALDSIVASTARSSLQSLGTRGDAACIVFSHSLLDSLLFSLCELSHSANAADWFPMIQQRQAKIADLLASDPHQIAVNIAKTHVDTLERESLAKKSDALHAVCKPSGSSTILDGYTFEGAALRSFDELRHSIVHGLKYREQIPQTESLITYARMTGIYFLTMVGRRYALQATGTGDELVSIIKDAFQIKQTS
ncbi:MAG TPA: hypothetical protein VK846_13905 [Candidatus Limnocylindria bacterium]|nr:hypothetical protein [Candidatus Limnocylindria bacterium]